MSIPSRSIRHPSQSSLNIPTPALLPQHPPTTHPSVSSRLYISPHAVPMSEIRPSSCSGAMNGTSNGGSDKNRYIRPASMSSEELRHSSMSQSPLDRTKRPKTSARASKEEKTSPSSGETKSGAAPNVLVREKKQKACANCRRAKLKCIVESADGDCVRCKARKEKCIFYPRSRVGFLFE